MLQAFVAHQSCGACIQRRLLQVDPSHTVTAKVCQVQKPGNKRGGLEDPGRSWKIEG
jgi:hypothetical protein